MLISQIQSARLVSSTITESMDSYPLKHKFLVSEVYDYPLKYKHHILNATGSFLLVTESSRLLIWLQVNQVHVCVHYVCLLDKFNFP